MICHACGGDVKVEGFISRRDECPACGAEIHCCLNCVNYDPAAHNRCREPQAEWVTDRERGNFCDFFTPNRLAAAGGHKGQSAGDSRKAFDDLFKK